MKTALLIVPALVATSLFAQDPGAFGGRRFNALPQGGPNHFRGMHTRGMRMRGRMGEGRGFAFSRMLEDPMIRQQIGVSADQAAKIRQQQTDFEKAEIRNRADLQVKRLELNQLMSVDKPDRAAVDAKVGELSIAQAAMEKAVIDNRLNMRDALTPMQRQRLQQIVAQRRQSRFGPGARGNFGPANPPAGRGNRGAAPNTLPAPAPRQ